MSTKSLSGLVAIALIVFYIGGNIAGVFKSHKFEIAKVSEELGAYDLFNKADSIIDPVKEATEPVSQEPLSALKYENIKVSNIKPHNESPYIFVNSGVPFFTEDEINEARLSGFERYSGFDALGRTCAAEMVVTHQTAINEERADISGIHPSGWKQSKYDLIEDGWIYNRCHLLMHAAGGDDIAENLITGTQYLNTEGMWGVEQTVYYHALEHEDAQILYRVTPLYEGSELIARGVLMEAYSLEDNGKSVCFCVYCYNVQPWIGIDYNTGDTWQMPVKWQIL